MQQKEATVDITWVPGEKREREQALAISAAIEAVFDGQCPRVSNVRVHDYKSATLTFSCEEPGSHQPERRPHRVTAFAVSYDDSRLVYAGYLSDALLRVFDGAHPPKVYLHSVPGGDGTVTVVSSLPIAPEQVEKAYRLSVEAREKCHYAAEFR